MSVTDPISDMLTQVRNALAVRKDFVILPVSKLKVAIANLLQAAGYLVSVETVSEEGQKFPTLKLVLKYSHDKSVIQGLRRVSKPGQRIYEPASHIRPVLNGSGISVVSTPQGLMTDQQARDAGLGGEVLFKVW